MGELRLLANSTTSSGERIFRGVSTVDSSSLRRGEDESSTPMENTGGALMGAIGDIPPNDDAANERRGPL